MREQRTPDDSDRAGRRPREVRRRKIDPLYQEASSTLVSQHQRRSLRHRLVPAVAAYLGLLRGFAASINRWCCKRRASPGRRGTTRCWSSSAGSTEATCAGGSMAARTRCAQIEIEPGDIDINVSDAAPAGGSSTTVGHARTWILRDGWPDTAGARSTRQSSSGCQTRILRTTTSVIRTSKGRVSPITGSPSSGAVTACGSLPSRLSWPPVSNADSTTG
jgi:hypothetical protein